MSQTSSEERRKFVLIVSGPAVEAEQVAKILRGITEYTCKWKFEASHTVSMHAKIQVVDEPEP